MIDKIYELFESVSTTSGSKAKFKLIKDFIDISADHYNQLQQIVRYTYDPSKVFGISIAPSEIINPPIENHNDIILDEDSWPAIRSLLDVYGNTPNSNVKRSAFLQTLGACDNKACKWLIRVINKDLNIGIGEKTWFKIFPNLYKKFEVMLCEKLEKQTWDDERIVEHKYDGFRCIIDHRTPTITKFYSREGTLLNNLEHIEKELNGIEEQFIIDCEAIGKSFSTTASILMSQKPREDAKEIKIKAFDYMPTEYWDARDGSLTWEERRLYLETWYEKYISNGTNSNISLSYFTRVQGNMAAKEKCKEYHEEGLEGGVIKDPKGTYVWGDRVWLKWKPVFTEDLKITGINIGEEDGKYQNTIGSLQIEGTITWKSKKINVAGNASGLTDSDRELLLNEHSQGTLIGKMAEFEFQEVTKNKKTGIYSIRFPQFIRMRPDKS